MIDHEKLEDLFWQHVGKPNENGCWLWHGQKIDKTVYYGVICKLDGKYVFAHRYAYELFRGAIEDGHVVRHTCKISLCVNPDHLYTRLRINPVKRSVPPRNSVGSGNNNAKLTDTQVREIKHLLSEHVMSQAAISRLYHVSRPRISEIHSGKAWAHLK